MFGFNKRLVKKIIKKLDMECECKYIDELKTFKLMFKGGLSQEKVKILSKLKLEIVSMVTNPDSNDVVIELKRKSILASVVIFILSAEVMLFGLVIFIMLLKFTSDFRFDI